MWHVGQLSGNLPSLSCFYRLAITESAKHEGLEIRHDSCLLACTWADIASATPTEPGSLTTVREWQNNYSISTLDRCPSLGCQAFWDFCIGWRSVIFLPVCYSLVRGARNGRLSILKIPPHQRLHPLQHLILTQPGRINNCRIRRGYQWRIGPRSIPPIAFPQLGRHCFRRSAA